MRYKFRGKQITTGEWIYGVPVQEVSYGAMYIVSGYDGYNSEMLRQIVDPDTVGQWTGRTDKSGTEVYEGDQMVMDKHSDGFPCVVEWKDDGYMVGNFGPLSAAAHYGTVVGNIHDK